MSFVQSFETDSQPPLLEETREYKISEGYVYATDISNELMKSLSDMPPYDRQSEELSTRAFHEVLNSSILGLYYVCQPLWQGIEERGLNSETVQQYYDVSDQAVQKAARMFTYNAGLGDLHFTWQAAPAIAANIVESFQKDQLITSEHSNNITLRDWANIIRSDWFSKLMHSMAYTRNGVYERLGYQLSDYTNAGLYKHLSDALTASLDGKLFVSKTIYEPSEDRTYLSAFLHPKVRQALRAEINPPGLSKDERKTRSPGCPVARVGATLLTEFVNTDPQIRRLLDNGTLHIVEDQSNDEKTVVRQSRTAIDYALTSLAAKIDDYDQMLGTPRLQKISSTRLRLYNALDQQGLTTNALCLPGKINSAAE